MLLSYVHLQQKQQKNSKHKVVNVLSFKKDIKSHKVHAFQLEAWQVIQIVKNKSKKE